MYDMTVWSPSNGWRPVQCVMRCHDTIRLFCCSAPNSTTPPYFSLSPPTLIYTYTHTRTVSQAHLRVPLAELPAVAEGMTAEELDSDNVLLKPYLKQLAALKVGG